MPSQRQGLTTQDKPLSGEGGVLTAIIGDLAKLEYGTYVVAEDEPMLPADGLLWFTPSSGIYQYWSAAAAAWKLVDIGGAAGLAAHIAASPIDHPDASVTAAKLAANAVTTAKILDANVTTAKILDANVTAAKLAAGAATDTVLGSRTVDDTLATPADAGTLTSLLSWLAGRVKAITGESGWKTAPATTLLAAKAHADSAAPHSGHQTPAGSQAQVDAHNAAQGAHGLYSGAGSPETVVAAAVGSLYRDTTNGLLYVKRTGAGNTGWVLEGALDILCRVYRSTNLDPSAGVRTPITWTGVRSDTSSIWAGGNPTRLTAPSDHVYRVGFSGLQEASNAASGLVTVKRFNSDGSGGVDLFDIHNGAAFQGDSNQSLIRDEQPVYLTAGQYVTLDYTPEQSTRGLRVASGDAGGAQGIVAWLAKS